MSNFRHEDIKVPFPKTDPTNYFPDKRVEYLKHRNEQKEIKHKYNREMSYLSFMLGKRLLAIGRSYQVHTSLFNVKKKTHFSGYYYVLKHSAGSKVNKMSV